jgi:hypothetical protein
VAGSRYVGQGLVVGVKRDMYVLREKQNAAGRKKSSELSKRKSNK